jgi:hypothetical protein
MASICSGVMLRAKRYISSRQVQKLSLLSPAFSVRPQRALEAVRVQVDHAGQRVLHALNAGLLPRRP